MVKIFISWAYWADAGKPTVNGEDPGSQTAFQNCVRDEKCNIDAVSGYMKHFEQVYRTDCDTFLKIIFNIVSII